MRIEPVFCSPLNSCSVDAFLVSELCGDRTRPQRYVGQNMVTQVCGDTTWSHRCVGTEHGRTESFWTCLYWEAYNKGTVSHCIHLKRIASFRAELPDPWQFALQWWGSPHLVTVWAATSLFTLGDQISVWREWKVLFCFVLNVTPTRSYQVQFTLYMRRVESQKVTWRTEIGLEPAV